MFDAGTTMLRVNQSRQRRAKDAWNDVAVYPEQPQPLPDPASLSRERLIRRVSDPLTSFPTRAHLRFTGLFLEVSGLTLWSGLTALALFFGDMQPTRTPN